MWDLYCYGTGDFVRMILNGVVMVFGNAGYFNLIKTAALIGFLAVMINAAFRRGQINLHWLMGVILIYLCLFVPKEPVIIVDRVVPANSSVVGNVPIGVALPITAFSHLGDWLTRSFETVFAMPTDIRYSDSGLLFANSLVEASSRFVFTEPRVKSNFNNFFKDCVYYDINLGLYSFNDMIHATNLMSFFQTHTSQARSFTYTPAVGSPYILNCRVGMNVQMQTDVDNEVSDATNIYGAQLVPNQATMNQSVLKFSAALPSAYQFLTGLAISKANIITQNSIANAFKNGLVNLNTATGQQAMSQSFTLTQAQSERETTFATLGQVAKKMLPILQGLFSAFLIAIAPIVFLMMLTPMAGKTLLGYGKALLWINLWSPLFVVLNFAVEYFSAKGATAAMIQQGAGFATGLSVMTNTGLGNLLHEYAAVAGYLSISIPMIAWMMVSQSGAMMAGLAGSFLRGYESPVSKASDEMVRGNLQYGNVGFENNTAFQENSAPHANAGYSSVNNGYGVQTDTTQGRFLKLTQSSSAEKADISSSIISASKKQVADATSVEQRASANMQESTNAVLSSSAGLLNRVNSTEGLTNSQRQAETSMKTEQSQQLTASINQWANTHGVHLSKDETAAVAAGVSSGALKFLGLNASANTARVTGEAAKSSHQYIDQYTKSQQFADLASHIGQASKELAVQSGISKDDSGVVSLDSSLGKQKSAIVSHTTAQSDLVRAEDDKSQAVQLAQTMKSESFDAVFQYATTKGRMTTQQFSELVFDAQRGNQSALGKLEHLTVSALGVPGSEVSGFDAFKSSLRSGGQSAVAGVNNTQTDDVRGVGTAWTSSTKSKTPATEKEIDLSVQAANTAISQTRNDPSQIMTGGNSATVEKGHDETNKAGAVTEHKVDLIRAVKDKSPLPGAAYTLDQGYQRPELNKVEEELKEQAHKKEKNK